MAHTRVTFSLGEDALATIDKHAEDLDVTRSELLTTCALYFASRGWDPRTLTPLSLNDSVSLLRAAVEHASRPKPQSWQLRAAEEDIKHLRIADSVLVEAEEYMATGEGDPASIQQRLAAVLPSHSAFWARWTLAYRP